MSRVAGRRHANGAMNCVECANPFFPGTREGLCFGCKKNPRSQQLAARNDDLEAALAQARKYEPIPVWRESTEWVDSSSVHPWGAPPKRSPLLKTWTRGNCLKACISSLLAADVSEVPDPTSEFHELDGWLERYNDRLREATGCRLERLPRSLCPPRKPTQLWIATISEDGPADHAVVARGAFVVHDPAGGYTGNVPMDRLVHGLLVVATQRIVPVLSPHGSGRMVVAA
jgi:hypothetical protein